MATYYWGGGAGTWDATTTTNWYSNVGRTTLAGSAPTSADNVIFDSASNATAYAVTIGTNAVCLDVTIAGPASGNVTITSSATSVIYVYGNWTNAATGVAFTTANNAAISFSANTTGKTITTNNVTLGLMTVYLGGVDASSVNGEWTLGSNFTSTSSFTSRAGVFNTGNFALNVGSLGATGTTVRSMSLGSSAITCTTAVGINVANAANLTFNAGTSTITCSNNSFTLNGAGLTYYNVIASSVTATTHVIQGANTFNNLTYTSRTTDGIGFINLSANQTINGTLTIGAANTAVRRLCVRSSTVGTQYTLTAATIATLADVDFQDTVAAGASGTWSGTRLGNCTNNSNITFSAGKTVYWNLASAQSWSAVGWAATTGTAPAVNNFPLAQDTAVFDDTGSVTGIITINAGWNIGTLNITKTGAMTLASGTQTPRFFSNVTLQSATVTTGTGAWTYAAYGVSSTFTSNGATFTPPLTINAPTGILTLGSALTQPSTVTTILTAGTLDLNNQTLTTGLFASSNSNVRTLAFGSTGKIVLTSTTGTVLSMSTATNFTYTGTSRIEVTASGAGRTITPPATSAVESNAMSIYVTTGSDTVTVSGSARFLNFDLTGFAGTLTYASGTRYFGNLVFSSGMTLGALSGGFTFAKTSGTQTITSAGKTIGAGITIDAPGAIVSLQNALSLTGTLILTNGTLTTNGYAVTTGTFSSNNSNTRVLNLGASTVTISGTGTFWDITTSTGMTLNAGTSSLLFTGNSAVITFAGGGLTYYNVTFGATFYNTTITGVNTFNNFTVTSPPSAGRRLVALSNNNQVINGTFSSVGSAANQRILYTGGTSGTTSQITATAISIADTDFSSIIAAGPATPWNGTRIGNGGTGSSNITFATARTVYWNKPAGGNWSDNAWSLSSGGGVSIDNFPLGQDTVILNNTGVGAVSTIVMDYGWNVGSLNAGSLSNALTMNWNTFDSRVCGFNGNVTLSSAITLTATQGATSFDAGTITTAGVVFPMAVTFNTVSGTMILADNFTCTGAYAGLASGTLDLNGKTLSCLTFDSTFTDLQPRQIAFNGGQIDVTGNNATVWACENVTNFSYTGTPTVNFTYSGSTGTRTINHGGTAGATEANVVDFNIVAGGDFWALGSGSQYVRNLTFQPAFTGSSSLFANGIIYGNVLLSPNQTITVSTSGYTNFASTTGTKTITTNGVVINRNFNFSSGSWILGSDLIMGSQGGLVLFSKGTFSTNNYNVTSVRWQYSYGVGDPVVLNLGSSTITLISYYLPDTVTIPWQMGGSGDLTINGGTSNIVFNTDVAQATMNPGYPATEYYKITQAGSNNLLLNTGFTFDTLQNTAQPTTITFRDGNTFVLKNFNVKGTAGNLVTIASKSPGTQFNLTKNTGSKVLVSYCTISDSNITPTGYWFAPTSQGNVDGGNNTGWNFSANGLENNFFLMF